MSDTPKYVLVLDYKFKPQRFIYKRCQTGNYKLFAAQINGEWNTNVDDGRIYAPNYIAGFRPRKKLTEAEVFLELL